MVILTLTCCKIVFKFEGLKINEKEVGIKSHGAIFPYFFRSKFRERLDRGSIFKDSLTPFPFPFKIFLLKTFLPFNNATLRYKFLKPIIFYYSHDLLQMRALMS